MRQTYDLPGSPHRLTVLRFGAAGAGRKAYLQAGLHADEFPGMLVLRILAGHLAEAEAHGGVHGEILLVPQANPIGLAQTETTFVSGRIDNATGENFNRNYPICQTSEACRWGQTRRRTSQRSGPRCPRGLRRCSRMGHWHICATGC